MSKLSARTLLRATLAALLLCLGAASAQAATIYVDQAALGANDGSSWTDAYTDLQSALATVGSGDQIWVARGVYTPSVQVDVDGGGADPREATFQIPSGAELYGGFAGGEALLSERDWVANPTVLSGDIDGNDLNLDGNDIAETTADLVGDNAYHVVYTQSVAATTRLDGFVVTAGEAGDFLPLGFSPNRDGGGWYNDDNPPADISSPAIHNTRFSGNYADARGGAFFIGSFTAGTYAPEIVGCEFSGNEAFRSGGAAYLLGDTATVTSSVFTNNATTAVSMGDTLPAAGGAVFLIASNAVFDRCVFSGNSATGNPTGAFEGGGGGAVYVSHSVSPTDSIGSSHPVFINCGFYDNSVGGNGSAWGGAATHLSDGGNLRVSYTGCVFAGNTATDDGGAIANFARTLAPPAVLDPILEPTYTNCTFTGNSAGQEGGAIYHDGFVFAAVEMLTARIENSILYADSAGTAGDEIFNSGGTINVATSLVDGSGGSGGGWDATLGSDGGGNIDADPQFVNAADPDGADDTPGTVDDGLFPDAASVVVDAGNDAAAGLAGVGSDFAANTRIQGTAVDLGAYETATADNCPDHADPDQTDGDCDGFGNVCDLCTGGDDSIDNNGDGLPDCAFPPDFSEIVDAWKCGKKKVSVCHNTRNPHTICVSKNAVAAHIGHGDYLGSCGEASCM